MGLCRSWSEILKTGVLESRLMSDQTVGGCAVIEQCHVKIDIETIYIK